MALNPESLLPRRNPGLIQRIFGTIVGNDPGLGPDPAERTSTQSGMVNADTGGHRVSAKDYFATRADRLSVYNDADELDALSEEASVALDTIADNACSSADGQMIACRIEATDPRVQAVIDRTTNNVDLATRLYSYTRSALKYGDFFGEVVVNGVGDVVDWRSLPPRTMYRNQDDAGNLALGAPRYAADGTCMNGEGDCAYEQRDAQTDQILAAFYPWQVIHGRWNHDGHSAYGRSYLRVARIIWKKLHAEEEALIIGRLVRAMLKLVFYVDTTGMSQPDKVRALQRFKEAVTTRTAVDGRRDNPFSVNTDFYLAVESIAMRGQIVESRTKVDSIDPKNEGLQQIDDIKHFHRKFLATLRVPPAYMTFEEQVNSKSTLSAQDVQFIRFVRRVQQFMAGLVRQLLDTALVLQGIDVAPDLYRITWPELSVTDELNDAQAFYQRAQAFALLLGKSNLNQQPVIDPMWVLTKGLDIEDEDAAAVLARIQEQLRREQQQAQQQMEAEAKAKIEAARAAAPQVQPPPQAPANQPAGGDEVRQEVGRAVGDMWVRLVPELTRMQAEQSRAATLVQEVATAKKANGHIEALAQTIDRQGEAMGQAVAALKEAVAKDAPAVNVNVQSPARKVIREAKFHANDKGEIVGKTETETEESES